uniref:EGF-like domain-containing protein n=1 Tax=Trichuris muris TaxID=70415 RepID=A0A5S6R518_TRIMR
MADFTKIGRTNDAYGNLQTTNGLRIITNDQFSVLHKLDSFSKELTTNSTFFIRHTIVRSEGEMQKDIKCTFDRVGSNGKCRDLKELFANKAPLLKMRSAGKTFCLQVTLLQNDNQLRADRIQLHPCETKAESDGFMCVHDSYVDCHYSLQQTECRRMNKEHVCARNVIVDVWDLPEMPFRNACPSYRSYECDCADQLEHGKLPANYPCLNGATKARNENGTVRCVCLNGYGGKRCENVLAPKTSIMYYVEGVLIYFAFVIICLLIFTTCVLSCLTKTKRSIHRRFTIQGFQKNK